MSPVELVGQPPPLWWEPAYGEGEVLLLGLLLPEDWLQLPNGPVCRALLEGRPVWYWPDQSWSQASRGGALRRLLLEQSAQLERLGVVALPLPGGVLRAGQVEGLLACGWPLPPGCKMTPLAKERWKELGR